MELMLVGRRGQGLLVAALLGVMVLLGACTLVQKPGSAEVGGIPGHLTAISGSDFPLSATIPQTTTTALVITRARANVRSGPGLGFPIVAKADPGAALGVGGRSEDKNWWQVCCVTGAAVAGQGEPGWMSGTVVKLQGDPQSVATVSGVLPDDLTAKWAVDWRCVSTRQNCKVPQCSATIGAKIDNPSQAPWQKVSYTTTWDKSCGASLDTPGWSFEVNKYSGQERSQAYLKDLLYDYWSGAQPAAATHIFTMDDGRKVLVHCSGPQTKEVKEAGGYVTVYEGKACHDIRTGILVILSYTKKWLYSGKIGGQMYDRAYLGDSESLDQYLVDSNANLYYVK